MAPGAPRNNALNSERRDQAAGEDDLEAADPVGEPAEEDEQRGRDSSDTTISA
jgi:hypothetical protein